MRIFLLLLAMLAPALAHAASQVRSPNNCVSTDIGNPGSGWTNPDRAETSNNQVATATANDNQSTDALVCTGYGFTLPGAATVLGIIIRIERRTNDVTAISPTRDAVVRALKNGVAMPTEGATATDYTLADVVEDHGSATELWGTTWTAADINNANFGAGFVAQKAGAIGGNVTISVDHIQIEVFYNTPPPAPTLASPADGASVGTPTPTLGWNAAVDPDGDAVTYDIEVDDSGCTFPSPEYSQSGIAGTSAVPSALPNATYCWRVRAVDPQGASSAWSATRSFTVNAGVATPTTASPGNCVSVDVGNPNWGNPDRAETNNASYATVGVNDNQASDQLVCTQYGFAIPAGATILGIVISVERRAGSLAAPTRDFSMRVLKAGAAQAAERATTTNYTNADTVEDHGGASDLWGTTWTPAEINDANFGARFQVQKVGTAGAGITVSVDHMPITVYWVIPAVVTTPEGFNAVEVAADAITGQIQTKVAGSAFSLDVVAVSGGALMAGFGGTVLVDVLGNAALGVALDAQNCPTSFTVVQTVGTNPTLVAGRVTVNFGAVANSWRDVRVRVRYPTGSPTVTACSADNFAIRPNDFSLEARDQDWDEAGTARVLANGGAIGGNVHKAGQPFRLIVTPSPGTATNYNGSPIESARSCTLPAGCATGNLSLGAFNDGGSGTRVSDSTYDEVGAFSLTLVDQDYASVDADDTPAACGGRYVCQSAAATIGRFVPDHFAITSLVTPQLRTFNVADAGCSPPALTPARSFSYVGQTIGYVPLTGAPQVTVEARNAAGVRTTNYRGALWKLAAAGMTQTFSETSGKAMTSTVGAGTMTAGNAAPTFGTGVFAADSTDTVVITRSAVTPEAPFNAAIRLRLRATDTSENNGTTQLDIASPDFDFNNVGFDSGNEFRYGRLRMTNVNGSQLVAQPLRIETQYWGGVAGFITNAADHCTSFANANFAMSAFSSNLAACETAVSGAGTLTSGRRTLLLAAPGSGNSGAVTLTANLGGDSGTTCTATGGGTVTATGANRPYLQGNWTGAAYDDNPTARATFGASPSSGEIIFIRENFQP